MSMIPIGDDDSDRTVTSFINYFLIVANIAVFVLLQGMGANDRFTYAFSTAGDGGSRSGRRRCRRMPGRKIAAKALLAGFQHHVPKPVDPDLLLGVIAIMARKSVGRDEER